MKTKMSKKSTITVTILACLLAVAVATTIVLAAFSANKTATTTVKFSNGVQIKINGAYVPNGSPTADEISRQANLMWACTETGGSLNNTDSLIDNVSNTVTFQAITFENGNVSESDTAWFIARASIGAPSGVTLTANQLAAIDYTIPNTWTAIGSTGWYAYTNGLSADTDITISSVSLDMADVATSATVPFVTAASISVANMTANSVQNADINMLAAAQYEAYVEIYAINAHAADAQTVLSGIVNPSP
jgi:hypothetical protein